jgi:ring-1,2-phenylacetyl-CoA epoxidase subunit PaaD
MWSVLSEIDFAILCASYSEIALGTVIDIVELGVIRSVKLNNKSSVEITITPTYSGCPAMKQMEDDVRKKLLENGFETVNIHMVYQPAWTTDWMTTEAHEKLRAYGIAPPLACVTSAAHANASESKAHVLTFAKRTADHQKIACPQCTSDNTTEISHFGSTACKALYKCLACLETFDYFKPY